MILLLVMLIMNLMIGDINLDDIVVALMILVVDL